ncbi:hypothetical protein MBLNU459_g0782t1 [Dothideomycetes sp. NU459]
MSKARSTSPIPEEISDIDEDPFSHFLSPVLDEDDPFEGAEYSAGINNFDTEVENKREKFRVRLGQKWDRIISRRPSSPEQQAPRTPPSEDQLPDLVNDDARSTSPTERAAFDDDADGWEGDRQRQRQRTSDFGFPLQRYDSQKATFGAPLQRPRFKTSRTLSGRKHSYVEPSFDLWNIDEEEESQEITRPPMRGRRWTRS